MVMITSHCSAIAFGVVAVSAPLASREISASGDHVGNRFRVTVRHHQRVTRFQQIFAHRFAHNAKTDKTYFDCHNVLSLFILVIIF
nr:putative protein [uncultured bacterium]